MWRKNKRHTSRSENRLINTGATVLYELTVRSGRASTTADKQRAHARLTFFQIIGIIKLI